MENPFLLSSRHRLAAWKDLRKNLATLPDALSQINRVQEWWKLAPCGKPYLDYLHPDTWPDAWSLLDNNDFDPASISIGIFYTLLYADDTPWKDTPMELMLLRSTSLSHENLCCVIDGNMVINFTYDAVDMMHSLNDISMQHRYTYDSKTRQFQEIKIG